MWKYIFLAAVGFCIYLAYKNRGNLKHSKIRNDRILDEWSVLIENADGKHDSFVKSMELKSQAMDVPDVKFESREIRLTGLLLSGTRSVIIARNKYLKGYRIFISARDYGHQLSVSWHLTQKQSFLLKLATAAAKNGAIALIAFPVLLTARILRLTHGLVIPEGMDIFEREEFSAYVGTVHNFVKDAAEEIMTGLNQDFSKVDTKTRGFLKIS